MGKAGFALAGALAGSAGRHPVERHHALREDRADVVRRWASWLCACEWKLTATRISLGRGRRTGRGSFTWSSAVARQRTG